MDYEYRYATRLRYAAVTVNLTVKPTTLAFTDGLPVRDEWEDFMEKEVRPGHIGGVFTNFFGLTSVFSNVFSLRF